MKKIIKAIVIVLICLIYGVGCDILPSISFIGSTSSSSNITNNEVIEGCQKTSESNSSQLKTSSIAIKLAKKVSDIFDIARKSTAQVTACYLIDDKEYETQASGFVIGKSEEVNQENEYTYYLATNASRIFYRYLKSVGTVPNVNTDTIQVRDGQFEISFDDGRRYIASYFGAYITADIAVLKFESEDIIEPLKIGDSNNLKVGEQVVAIGTPLSSTNLINSCISGTISGLERDTDIMFNGTYQGTPYSYEIASYMTFQMDIPTNRGMEGGPVLNTEGEVIGMTSYKYSGSSNYESISFAIGISEVYNVASQIIKNGEYVKPIFGITVADAKHYINEPSLAWISEYDLYDSLLIVPSSIGGSDTIAAGYPAYNAGMKDGEVIVKMVINDIEHKVTSSAALSSKILQLKKGDVVKVITINSSNNSTTYTLDLWS